MVTACHRLEVLNINITPLVYNIVASEHSIHSKPLPLIIYHDS